MCKYTIDFTSSNLFKYYLLISYVLKNKTKFQLKGTNDGGNRMSSKQYSVIHVDKQDRELD